jgi:hypothetical protein
MEGVFIKDLDNKNIELLRYLNAKDRKGKFARTTLFFISSSP